MSHPTNPYPGPNPPTGPGPCVDDPTGLTFDRADLDEPATTRTAGAGWAVTGRGPYAMQIKDCCGIGAGEACDCAEMTRQLHHAPVIRLAPFNLRQLAAQHITAAEQDRRERGAA
ncbi:hypothetical protein [Micromonospora sp. WMMD980]|uniref:hypothetical protein n=1 Tax=Micromonospora sp. WMMD980 TaxID=3016088 RepID=UPI002417E7F4|nr:hypothetical protein [Micromonospora sp. WMMD980]MDG4798951.1 hypothetical protein [Micromonospora sp. WMMD980]MDG4798976.1 hypothetical protein [Micromonospora sp. WMMD980]MDG4799017.1 hypothetical protein [Micromonospora sp. WMMD980]